MASVSVKDRAKMFGDLTSTGGSSKIDEAQRKREFGNKVVSSSPFLAASSPKTSPSVPLPAYSMSPRSIPFNSSVVAFSPKGPTSSHLQKRDQRPHSYGGSPRTLPLRTTSPRVPSNAPKNAIDWPVEDSIPAPSILTKNKPSGKAMNNTIDYLKKPVVLPQSPGWTNKNRNSDLHSPLKALHNKDHLHHQSPAKNPTVESFQFDYLHAVKEANYTISTENRLSKKEDTAISVKNTVDKVTLTEKRTVGDAASEDNVSIDRSTVSDNENKAPDTDSVSKPINGRALRLMRAKRAGAKSPAPMFPASSAASVITEQALKSCLDAAKVVMEEEKSCAGSSNASSRSSLSNKELSDIASRALKMSKEKISASHGEIERPTSIRGNRTISKVTPQEARLALLNAAKKKNRKDECSKVNKDESDKESHLQKEVVGGASIAERLGEKANRAVQLKNLTRTKSEDSMTRNLAINVTESHDSSRTRRLEHPAFAGRVSPMPKAKVNSADIMSSFRQFNNLRSTGTPDKTVGKVNSKEDTSERCKTLYLPTAKQLGDALGPRKSLTPKASKDPAGKNDRLSLGSAGDNSMVSQSSDLFDQEETMHSTNQDETMHSTEERNYVDSFYHMGNVDVQLNSANSVNDAYLSSLSSNTFSNQSIMSQSVNTMKSPVGKHNQNEKVAFLLDPTPEHSNQTMKSDLLFGMSPGPSNRSAHSFANSIMSASPKSATPHTPTFNSAFGNFFNENTKESTSTGNDSGQEPPELLDAAIQAAVNDSTRVTPSEKQKRDGSINGAKETIEPSAMSSPRKVIATKAMSILPNNSSCRSSSPPGFVFNDSDESDVVVPPDPVGKEGHTLADNLFGLDLDDEQEDTKQGGDVTNVEDQKSEDEHVVVQKDFDAAPNEDGEVVLNDQMKVDSFPSSDDIDDSARKKDKQGSSSTKQTVSTSIRTGFSSIQNDPVVVDINSERQIVFEGFEGSSSIRTGLSGLQEKESASEREKRSILDTESNAQQDQTKSPNPLRFPDTIQEENESKSALNSDKSTAKEDQSSIWGFKVKDEHTSFSEFRNKSTSTTDGSLTTNTASGASGTYGPSSSSYSGYDTRGTEISEANPGLLPQVRNLLSPIRTGEGSEMSCDDNDASLLTPASKKSSTGWKSGKFGKRVGDAIKNVLAKASPRANGHSATPSNHGGTTPSNHGTGSKRQESRSVFSSVDDEEDIFGGLDDETIEEMKATASTPKTPSAKTPKSSAKTPKQRNSKTTGKKGTTGRSGSVPSARVSNSARLEARSTGKSTGRSKSAPPTKTSEARKDIKSIKTSNARGFKMPAALSMKHQRKTSSPCGTNASSLYSHDRSGTVVDESEVLHVNSDITSSLIGGPISAPSPKPPKKDMPNKKEEFEDDAKEPKSQSNRKSKVSKSSIKADAKADKNRKLSKPKTDEKSKPKEVDAKEPKQVEEEKSAAGSMFMNLGCGGFMDLSTGFASLCTPGHKVDEADEVDTGNEVGKDCNSISASSHSRLTDLEKKVWSEWDRLNGSVLGGPPEEPKEKVSDNKKAKKEKKEHHDKKRELARDKLLDIASTAMSSHLSGKTGDAGDNGTLMTNDNTHMTNDRAAISASHSTESGGTKDTGASGASGSASGTESGDSAGSSSQESGSSTEYSSGIESDFVSETSSNTNSTKPHTATTPAASPILLSISQKSLMDKFSKQLSAVGAEVLKLNRRKQWQIRYFTVSKEQIALSAHEEISKTGELAHCPKGLLWLKKFNPKSGGYSITSIDKDGHGGMLFVDLVDIAVSDAKVETLETPIPKKLMDKFKESVLVTLQYKMSGSLRSIEFRCKDNDEAQFLCTCMRVIRDLLRRERSLRQKKNKLEKKKATANLKTIPVPTKK